MKKWLILAVAVFFAVPSAALSTDEGTRHITGSGLDIYFMSDKVFGTLMGNPLWAVYNCGSEIDGEIDIKGDRHAFSFKYHRKGDRKITGTFGPLEVALGTIEKKGGKFFYQVFVGETEHLFSIRYEKMEKAHLVNAVIEGRLGPGRELTFTADGLLCPFATTGIIMIVTGAMSLA